MAKRQGGSRRKTRHKLQKRKRDRGKVTITRKLQEFKVGDRVRILQEPAMQKGMPSAHFKNSVGEIVKKQGQAYVLELKDLGKVKRVISAGVHLSKL